jgi:hypothetical protein
MGWVDALEQQFTAYRDTGKKLLEDLVAELSMSPSNPLHAARASLHKYYR